MLKTPIQTLDAVTDDAGEYQFTNLLPGAYTLKATVQGFKTASRIVTIRAGETSVENISLEAAAGAATVTGASSTSGQAEQTTETAPATSAQQETNNETFKDPTARVFELVLPGEHLLGDWGRSETEVRRSGHYTEADPRHRPRGEPPRWPVARRDRAQQRRTQPVLRSGKDRRPEGRLRLYVVFAPLGPQPLGETYRQHLQHTADFWLSDMARH
jgi:hypothetical protein